MFTFNMEVHHRTGIQYTLVPLGKTKAYIATISVDGSFKCPECKREWHSSEIVTKIIYYPQEHAFNAKAYRQACQCGILVSPKLDDTYVGHVESKLTDLAGFHEAPRRSRANAFYEGEDEEPPPKKRYCVIC